MPVANGANFVRSSLFRDFETVYSTDWRAWRHRRRRSEHLSRVRNVFVVGFPIVTSESTCFFSIVYGGSPCKGIAGMTAQHSTKRAPRIINSREWWYNRLTSLGGADKHQGEQSWRGASLRQNYRPSGEGGFTKVLQCSKGTLSEMISCRLKHFRA